MSDSVIRSPGLRSGELGRLVRVSAGLLLVASLSVVALTSPSADASSPDEITNLVIQKVGGNCDTAPVTFGQPFKQGDLARNAWLVATYNGQRLPTQVDVKARNDDGSARHAVITLNVPCSAADSGKAVTLLRRQSAPEPASKPDVTLSDVAKSDYDSRVTLQFDGTQWQLNARDLMQQVDRAGGCANMSTSTALFCKRWLKGPLTSEWVIGAPLQNADGQTHPHLMAYFAVRAYGSAPVTRVRTDVTVENNWAYVADPQNYRYQPTISVAGRSEPAYRSEPFTHYRQARWHHVVWWGENEQRPLYAKINSAYLQSTAAVPQYARGQLSSKLLKKRQSCPPMKSCGQTAHMEQTGSQDAIGPLPRWSAAFVINPDYRIFRWMLANTDALGGYAFHYRQQDTGAPLSVRDHPCATKVWPARQARCKAPPHGDDRFPKCKGDCKSPLHPDISHHPAPAYAAYLATGDWYYANEMSFIGSWVTFWQNPGYRGYREALLGPHTSTRGQAWSLRTLADVAYLLPDSAHHKKYFNNIVANNIRWYTKNYVDKPDENKLGAVRGRFGYGNGGVKHTSSATWQQSFFAWSIGNLAEKRFAGAKRLRDYFSRFQILMMTSPDYCWPLASAYTVRLLKSPYGDFYDTIGEVYRNSFPHDVVSAGCEPAALNAAIRQWKRKFHYPPNTMIGYPHSPTGFPANFQIGLAAGASSAVPDARKAWNIFASRPVQPDYRSAPQFAVVPTRNQQK